MTKLVEEGRLLHPHALVIQQAKGGKCMDPTSTTTSSFVEENCHVANSVSCATVETGRRSTEEGQEVILLNNVSYDNTSTDVLPHSLDEIESVASDPMKRRGTHSSHSRASSVDDSSLVGEIRYLDSFGEHLARDLEQAELEWRKSVANISPGDLEKLDDSSDDEHAVETVTEDSSWRAAMAAYRDGSFSLSYTSLMSTLSDLHFPNTGDEKEETAEKMARTLIDPSNLQHGDVSSQRQGASGSLSGLSLGLASELLASRLYSSHVPSVGILPQFFKQQLHVHNTNVENNWKVGIPILGSALMNGRLFFMVHNLLTDDDLLDVDLDL